MSMMPFLVLPRGLLPQIRRIVFETGLETGMRLVGHAREGRYLVRHVIPPGTRAIHARTYYECDNEYAETLFNELLARDPDLQFLGELHVHTDGDPRLSRRDVATVGRVLREFPFFVAGVILRRPFSIRPFLFSRNVSVRMKCVLL